MFYGHTRDSYRGILPVLKRFYVNLTQTYQNLSLDQLKIMMSSIAPQGVVWKHTSYSNNQILFFYQAFFPIQNGDVNYGALGSLSIEHLLVWFHKLMRVYDEKMRKD